MTYRHIKVEERYNGEATEIIFGPAPANIISAELMKEVSAQLKIEEKNSGKKLIIFSGEGKHFSFGASVDEHKPELVNGMLPAFHKLIGEIMSCPIPTLASVRGLCLGGGFEVALACTYLYAEESAKFGVPEITLAVFPPVACILLPIRCGDAFSAKVILSGGQFPAKELHGRGLINECVEKDRLDETIMNFFNNDIKPRSASSLRIAKKALTMYSVKTYQDFIGRLESLYLKDLMSTDDAKEGIGAFLEKRKPVWKNS